MYVDKAKFYFTGVSKRFHGKCLFIPNAKLIQSEIRNLSIETFEVTNITITLLWWYEFHRFEIFKYRIHSPAFRIIFYLVVNFQFWKRLYHLQWWDWAKFRSIDELTEKSKKVSYFFDKSISTDIIGRHMTTHHFSFTAFQRYSHYVS